MQIVSHILFRFRVHRKEGNARNYLYVGVLEGKTQRKRSHGISKYKMEYFAKKNETYMVDYHQLMIV
jgi:hypothetical protein